MVRALGLDTPRPWPELIIGLLLALAIAGLSGSDPNVQLTPAERRSGWAIAVINGLYLAMAAFGVSAAGDALGVSSATTGK